MLPVVAAEAVAVPAGRFNAWKIVRETERRDSDQYWYAPDVRFYVKWIGRRGDTAVRRAAPGVSSGASLDSRGAFHGIAIHEVARRLAEIARPVPLACSVGLAIGLALLALRRFGAAPRWWQLLPLLGALALVVVLDLRIRVIPDIITLPGLAYALGLAALTARSPTIVESALGALVGGGVVLLVAIVSRGAMGGGDIKLMGMLGAALGWEARSLRWPSRRSWAR